MLIFCLGLNGMIPFLRTASVRAETPVIRVGYIDYAGFIEEDGAGKYTGYGVELLERISRITGWRYEYVYGDWQQILSQLDEGSIDLIMTAQYTEERADQFLFSQQPIGDDHPELRLPTSHNPSVLTTVAGNGVRGSIKD